MNRKMATKSAPKLRERLHLEKSAKLALLVLLTLVGSVVQAQSPVLFKNVRVFDGERVRPQTDVLVEGGIISVVGRKVQAPQDAEVIDGRGKTLLPGLIDAHVHAFAEPTLCASPDVRRHYRTGHVYRL